MQLQLTLAERQLLADILEDARYALAQDHDSGQQLRERETKAHEYEELFGRVVEKRLQFSADELDTLAALLNDRRRALQQQESAQEKKELLQSLTEKITELCVMF